MKFNIFKDEVTQSVNPLLVKHMEDIVNEVVIHSKFKSDFYVHDLNRMKENTLFAWFVYDSGTHFIPLDNSEDIKVFQREWVQGLSDFMVLKKDREKNNLLYVCNTMSGEIKQIHIFEEGDLIDRLQLAV